MELLVLLHVLPLYVRFVRFGYLNFRHVFPCLGCKSSLSGRDVFSCAKKWYCKNIDDCANLKHGCGALGLCALTLKSLFVLHVERIPKIHQIQ